MGRKNVTGSSSKRTVCLLLSMENYGQTALKWNAKTGIIIFSMLKTPELHHRFVIRKQQDFDPTQTLLFNSPWPPLFPSCISDLLKPTLRPLELIQKFHSPPSALDESIDKGIFWIARLRQALLEIHNLP